MKVLITGITGMAGSHMAEYLTALGRYEVHGTYRWRSNRENIAGVEKDITLHECELRDPYAVIRLMKSIRPDFVYHFAAQSSVASSWGSPQDTLINNTTVQMNVFEALRLLDMADTRVLVTGSSEEYGLVYKDELPVNELNPLRPMSPYGVSKITQSALAFQYFQNYGFQIVRTRTFNHTGPRRSETFATSNFAKQLVEIELKKREPVINVGNLDAKRDFSDIRDIVKAYHLAMLKGQPGEVYNLGSDQSISIRDVLDMLIDISGYAVELKTDPERLRPSDVAELRCDSSKFRKLTGWDPEIPLRETLKDLLFYWHEKMSKHSYHYTGVEVN
ncbi:MAG: GDP-mannose 4,6-dehydratase [Desulfobacteraceae bacterium]